VNRRSRLNAVLDAITEAGHADVDALARKLLVSPSTIRRDLSFLAEQQLLSRTHGGAVATTVNYDLPVRYRRTSISSEKVRIGLAAARLIPDGAVVALSGGTTTTQVARALAGDELEGSDQPKQVTIVTNAINIASEMTVRRRIKLIVTGGVSRLHSFELTGPLAYAALAQFDLDVAVLSVSALDPDWGAKVADEDEAGINRMMAERASTVIIAADSSKVSGRAFARVCPLADIDYVVSGAGMDPVAADKIRAAGVQLILV
jgi:DeoR family transcriptional regulator of aga operon